MYAAAKLASDMIQRALLHFSRASIIKLDALNLILRFRQGSPSDGLFRLDYSLNDMIFI